MDTQVLKAINYIRNISKKEVTYLNNAGASNWDKESVEANLKEIQTKSIIKENDKPLITLSSNSSNVSVIQDDVFLTSQEVDCCVISATANLVIPAHRSDPAIAALNTGSFVTLCTPRPFHSNSVISSLFSLKLDSLAAELCGKSMAIKSFFMDELNTIKNESLRSAKIPKHFN